MKKRWLWWLIVLVIVGLLGIQVYISDPSVSPVFTSPFTTSVKNNQIILQQISRVQVSDTIFSQLLRNIDAGVRILGSSWHSQERLLGSKQSIIAQIHQERFTPSQSYVITGGQFSDLYVRNLGIFYSSLLDGCIPSSQKDWENRERITTQTVAMDLSLLQGVHTEPTTFSPIWPGIYVPAHVYTRASDSLYGVLFTLSAMQHAQETQWIYSSTKACHELQTQQVSRQLLATHASNVTRLTKQYFKDVFDEKSGLVKKDITLASARDGVKRQSSFYDNVLLWATMYQANTLGLLPQSEMYFAQWKNRIIQAFWNEEEGVFINDLSSASQKDHTFSADEFIVLQTHFLDASNVDDKKKIEKMVRYVQQHAYDSPIPLQYSHTNPVSDEYFFVRLAAPAYMGESMWSHWGIEYIKALLLLKEDKKAQLFLQRYDDAITMYGGYPELYDVHGHIFQTLLYKSVLHTGWVINYEAVQAMLTLKSR